MQMPEIITESHRFRMTSLTLSFDAICRVRPEIYLRGPLRPGKVGIFRDASFRIAGGSQCRVRPAVLPGQRRDLQRRPTCDRVVGMKGDDVALGPLQD